VDTFNFSFSEDTPEDASQTPNEGADPASSAPSPAPAKDPFDFDDFGLDLEPEPDPLALRHSASDPFGADVFSLNQTPSSSALSASAAPLETPLELDPNAHLRLDDVLSPGDEAEFPDLSLAPSSEFSLDADPLAFDDLSPPPSETATEQQKPQQLLAYESALDSEPLFAIEPSPTPAFEPTPTSEPALALEPTPTSEPALALEPPAFEPPALEPATSFEPTPALEALQAITVSAAVEPTISAAPRKRFLTQDEPYGEVTPHHGRLRVAVVGASGIGFNHARWFDKHAGDIVAFLGSSEESIEGTSQKLEAELGHAVPGFSDLEQLLVQTQPQAVCIASPPALHFAQALTCLEAGAHVLCEKPLVYAQNRSKRENSDGARELLKTATKKQLVLASQLQYGAATPILCRLAGVTPLEVGDFAMEIETTNPRASRDPKELWVDLGPHPLSVAQFLMGESAELVEETLQVQPASSGGSTEVSVRFGVRGEGGRLLMCRAIVRSFEPDAEAREPRRRFAFNGRIVQYKGVKLADNTYIAQYVSPDGYISHYPDPVDFLVGNFVRTCWGDDQLVLSSAQSVQNLDWLLTIGDKIERP
jgi:hypothetical protein